MELTPQLLLSAYCQGIFPMAHEDGNIHWYDPDPRAILPLDAFHISRRLARTVRRATFQIRVNTAFGETMRRCATAAPDRPETWISDEIIAAYERLHALGFAHSVEAWQDGRLVGGLYGVAVNGFFAGESMFSNRRDASKVALVHLVDRLRERHFQLLDVQFPTDHLSQFGVITIPRHHYQSRLRRALRTPASFTE